MTQVHEIDKLSVIGIFTVTFSRHSCLANKVWGQTKRVIQRCKIYAHASNNEPQYYYLKKWAYKIAGIAEVKQ